MGLAERPSVPINIPALPLTGDTAHWRSIPPMKILFAATRAWTDDASVAAILDSIVGNEPVHIVVGAETRGPEAYVVEWVKQRNKVRRTYIDVVKAGKEFGTMAERSLWKDRRDAYMVKAGGYDVAVILSRHMPWSKSTRLDDMARLLEEAGVAVKRFDYDQTVKGATK